MVPVPGVFERGYLRIGLGAGFVFKMHVVIVVPIERWIEIDMIDGYGFYHSLGFLSVSILLLDFRSVHGMFAK
jgi:hypothetical protein